MNTVGINERVSCRLGSAYVRGVACCGSCVGLGLGSIEVDDAGFRVEELNPERRLPRTVRIVSKVLSQTW